MRGELVLNEDNTHYYNSRRNPDITAAEVDAWVDQYAGTQVKELVLNVNCMRTSYASEVWEPVWSGFDPEGGEDQPLLASAGPAERNGAYQWIHMAWQLSMKGIDLYERWIARSRQLGISPWISIRMNDVHNVNDESHYLHNRLWRERPDLRRITGRFEEWTDRAFDYGHKEVRAYHFQLIREVVERYDVDGIELDWMRFGYHFRPGFESEGAVILTEFTSSVRKLLDEWEMKRGHRIKLSARVPSRPETALALGMDAAEWAQQGLIDQLVVTPFWETIETDMPIEIWKQLLRGTTVTLAAGLEVLIRAYPASKLRQMNTLETVRGAAMSFLNRGADRIYLFNYMDSQTAMADLHNYPNLLREAGHVETLRGKPRRHIVTYADTWAPGEASANILPVHCAAGRSRSIRIHIGEKPNQQAAMILIGMENGAGLLESGCRVYLNGQLCEWAGERILEKPCPEGAVFGFHIPDHAMKDGFHVIEVSTDHEVTLGWVEIAIGKLAPDA
ncbi:hypothetical protein [Paenibacillus mendelii]|uniref:Glycosyl hydrolase-like 10 domain-containing protein n=1 Tax=Paenibacillus mendelii TaxID=206163 RepID=A0ABV6JFL1_9BACL|nr:hypothetical protein [Paenibacillus mendelii]MCQ6557536.1 hypothetical protein [Paenibacillus mendelii]